MIQFIYSYLEYYLAHPGMDKVADLEALTGVLRLNPKHRSLSPWWHANNQT
jgi:hypothetical protein